MDCRVAIALRNDGFIPALLCRQYITNYIFFTMVQIIALFSGMTISILGGKSTQVKLQHIFFDTQNLFCYNQHGTF